MKPRPAGLLPVLATLLVSGCAGAVSGRGEGSAPHSVVQASASSPAAAASPAATSPADIDPCGLVTKAQADELAGVTTMPPNRSLQLCTFATPTRGSVGQLDVFVGDGAKKFLDIDRDTLHHKFTTVAGLGDEAHLEDGVIFVRAGSTWFALQVTRLDDVDTGPLLKKVATSVLGRL